MGQLTAREITNNLQIAERAIAQPYLSGGQVSDMGRADLHRVAKGEITIEEAFRNLGERVRHAKTAKP